MIGRVGIAVVAEVVAFALDGWEVGLHILGHPRFLQDLNFEGVDPNFRHLV